jgi:ABC-type transport system involved in cytochrome c biogenesis permease component
MPINSRTAVTFGVRTLSIVERELRVAARQTRTWWRRLFTVAAGLAIVAFAFITVSRWSAPSVLGRELFSLLGGFAMVYALLAGPLATADCLGRERREGTLGLLFLTDLRSYDVVLGKMAAASFDLVLALAAALPLATLPFLMGGVTLYHFGLVVLAVLNLMFLSLAVGACASAWFASGRAALGTTLAVLLFLTLGLPLLGEQLLKIHLNSPEAPFFYLTCPAYTMERVLDDFARGGTWKSWLNLGGVHALAWLCLMVACWRTSRVWRELPAAPWLRRLTSLLERFRKGGPAASRAWRQAMLDQNPVAWLEGRDRLQPRLLWALVAAAITFWFAGFLNSPRSWATVEMVILWPLFAHYFLCLWIAIQAPRRLADDKHCGALELLLSTPLGPRRMVAGILAVLRRRFGGALLALMALDAFMVCAHVQLQQYRNLTPDHFLVQLSCYGVIVFSLQAWSMAVVGLYHGLVEASSVRASLIVIWKLGLLPWLMFFLTLLFLEVARPSWRFLPRLNEHMVFGSWAGWHVLVCGGFLISAKWRLNDQFRSLAAQTGRRGWRMWLPFARGLQ